MNEIERRLRYLEDVVLRDLTGTDAQARREFARLFANADARHGELVDRLAEIVGTSDLARLLAIDSTDPDTARLVGGLRRSAGRWAAANGYHFAGARVTKYRAVPNRPDLNGGAIVPGGDGGLLQLVPCGGSEPEQEPT